MSRDEHTSPATQDSELKARKERWEKWKDGQNARYHEQRSSMFRSAYNNGFNAYPLKKQGGYAVVLRKALVADEAQFFARCMRGLVPEFLAYENDAIFLPLVYHSVQDNFNPSDNHEHESVLAKLRETTSFIRGLGEHIITCNYENGAVCTEEGFLIQAEPSSEFLGVATHIQEQAKGLELDLVLPATAEIVCGKFRGHVSKEQADDLRRLCRNLTFGNNILPFFESVDVVWFTVDEHGMHSHIEQSQRFLQMFD